MDVALLYLNSTPFMHVASFSSATDHQIIYYCAIILSNQLPDLINHVRFYAEVK
jgi:hypothetical protein